MYTLSTTLFPTVAGQEIDNLNTGDHYESISQIIKLIIKHTDDNSSQLLLGLSLPPVCEEEDTSEQQERESSLAQVKLEPQQIKKEREEELAGFKSDITELTEASYQDCYQAFVYKSHLIEQHFTCTECGKVYNFLNKLKKHMLSCR